VKRVLQCAEHFVAAATVVVFFTVTVVVGVSVVMATRLVVRRSLVHLFQRLFGAQLSEKRRLKEEIVRREKKKKKKKKKSGEISFSFSFVRTFSASTSIGGLVSKPKNDATPLIFSYFLPSSFG
jgi:hypothetical protein